MLFDGGESLPVRCEARLLACTQSKSRMNGNKTEKTSVRIPRTDHRCGGVVLNQKIEQSLLVENASQNEVASMPKPFARSVSLVTEDPQHPQAAEIARIGRVA